MHDGCDGGRQAVLGLDVSESHNDLSAYADRGTVEKAAED
jgi:hypothetical protein